jgi:hypothetical protein
MLLGILLFTLTSWAQEKPPIEVKSIQLKISHTLPEIPPETSPAEIQNPNQGPTWSAQSEDVLPNSYWGVIMGDAPHLGGQIVLHGSDENLLGACEVTLIFDATGFEFFGTLNESNSTVDVLNWDGKKIRQILGDYKGWEFGISGLIGIKYRTVTHTAQGVELNDFAGEWGALGFNLGRSYITLAPRGSCIGNVPIDWQSVLKSTP